LQAVFKAVGWRILVSADCEGEYAEAERIDEGEVCMADRLEDRLDEVGVGVRATGNMKGGCPNAALGV
jgi:hypothetical protein